MRRVPIPAEISCSVGNMTANAEVQKLWCSKKITDAIIIGKNRWPGVLKTVQTMYDSVGNR